MTSYRLGTFEKRVYRIALMRGEKRKKKRFEGARQLAAKIVPCWWVNGCRSAFCFDQGTTFRLYVGVGDQVPPGCGRGVVSAVSDLSMQLCAAWDPL